MERDFEDGKPKSNGSTRVVLRFQRHEILNYEEGKKGLETLFRDSFVLGERNIFLAESLDMTDTAEKNFHEGFKKYGSYLMAHAYMGYIRVYGARRNDDQVRRTMQRFAKQGEGNSQLSFVLSSLEVIDQLRAEGYDLSLIFESRTPGSGYKDYMLGISNSVEDLKRKVTGVAGHVNKRNITVRNQIVAIANKARKQGQKTHILAIYGTAHSHISEMLPTIMRDKLIASCDNDPDVSSATKLLSKLAVREPISDDEWVAFYKEVEGANLSLGHFEPTQI